MTHAETPASALLSKIDGFLARTGMAPSEFGDRACNDRSFVDDLRRGRDPRSSTIHKVETFIAEFEASDEQDPDSGSRDHGGGAIECAPPAFA